MSMGDVPGGENLQTLVNSFLILLVACLCLHDGLDLLTQSQNKPFHFIVDFYQTFCQSREKSNLYPLGAEYYAWWQAYERENRAFGLLLQVIELQSFQVH